MIRLIMLFAVIIHFHTWPPLVVISRAAKPHPYPTTVGVFKPQVTQNIARNRSQQTTIEVGWLEEIDRKFTRLMRRIKLDRIKG